MKRLACALAAAVVSGASAQPFVYTKLVDARQAVPGGGGAIFGGDSAFRDVAWRGGRAAFVGRDQLGRNGVYSLTGGLLGLVADQNTSLPGSGEKYASFARTSIDGGVVSFQGTGTTFRFGGYARVDGVLTTIADNTTSAPDGLPFTIGGGSLSLSGREMSFKGTKADGAPGHFGIYRWNNGTTTKVVDTTTPVPGGVGNFKDFDGQFTQSVLNQGAVTFTGVDSASKGGIYRQDQSGLSMVYNTNSTAPAGLGMFLGFGAGIAADGQDLAFGAATSAGLPLGGGLFARVNGVTSLVFADGQIGPLGLPMTVGAPFAIAGGSVVWMDSNTSSVYTNFGGTISPVIWAGMTLGGKTVSTANFWREGRDGNTVAIAVKFLTDQPGNPDQAIYLVNLPAPGVLGVMAVGGIVAMRRSRRAQLAGGRAVTAWRGDPVESRCAAEFGAGGLV